VKIVGIFYIVLSISLGFYSNVSAQETVAPKKSLIDNLAFVACCGKAQVLQIIELVHGYGLALTVYPEELTNRYLLKVDEPKASDLILMQTEVLRAELVRTGCQIEDEQ